MLARLTKRRSLVLQNSQEWFRQNTTATRSIFDKIVSKEINAKIVYEDEKVLAFDDVAPQAPVHVLVIPKVRGNLAQLSTSQEADKETLGHLMWAASKVAEIKKINKSGFRVIVNDGADGCQSVFHLHLHVMGGRKLKWPPG